MNWLAALLTLAGTVVGASITLTAERMRWRRDQRERHLEARRDSYAGYLAALHTTSESIRAVSLDEHDADVRRSSAARAAFSTANLNAAREQIVLLAPASVVRAADKTFTTLRSLHDIVAQGGDLDSPNYRETLSVYQHALKDLRKVMREDLGTPSLVDDVTF
ncbi:hypothetical protein ABZ345_00395 [Lentzea sp. NPDC005914]|uniref:hypothetical protein n=1 Tax=Lentzea sp. NPDC005914 TaxID=3154572 RepID=UPI0033DEA433